jgi:hypothetical protein
MGHVSIPDPQVTELEYSCYLSAFIRGEFHSEHERMLVSDGQRTVTAMTPIHTFVKAELRHFPRAARGSAQNAFRAILAAVLLNALGRRPQVALADAYTLALRCVRAAPEWTDFVPRFV